MQEEHFNKHRSVDFTLDSLFGMAVARAGASDDHVVDGVVVLLLDVDRAAAKVLVTEGVQLGEGDAEVGHLEKVLHLLAVRVEAGGVGVDGAGKNSIDYLGKHFYEALFF